MKLESLALHHGYESEATTKSAAVPIYNTSSYTFDNTQHGADLFDLKVPGNIYTRIMNPTNAVLEQRIAAMEGGIGALAVASGMAAITYAIQCLCEVGTNIVSTSQVYGGTYNLFAHSLPRQDIEARMIKADDFDGFENAIDENTRAVFCESIGNPAGNIVDIARLAKIAHSKGVPLIVDNTVATPYLCRPFELGADIVVHSLTKYINGHGTAIGGMNVANTVEGLERYPINLRYPQGYRDSVEQMRLLPMVTPNGQRIALADVADIRIDQGPPMIKSENARINGWTLVDIEGRDLGSWVREAQSVVQEQVDLPAGYSLTWSGQYEYMQRAKERLTLVVPLTLAIIIILLYLNFRNLTEVGIILGTLPFGMIGGIWLMYLLGYNLSVAVAVGFIALAGVAVEIGVLMLVYLNQSLHNALETVDHQSGQLSADALRKAISDGAAQRVRPIMMTFAAIVAGLVPIMLGSGTGSEVMQRIAGPMIGGMVTTLILTLLLIPVIFYLWQRARLKKIAKKGTFR